MYSELLDFLKRPDPFSRMTTKTLWTDPHIAAQMLNYHIDQSTDVASRAADKIDEIVLWLDSVIGFADKRVCDLGCGPGLYAERFAAAGALVTGLDFSSGSIEYAREQARANGGKTRYLTADYLLDPLPQKLDLVTLIYFDYCAISPEARTKLLGTISESLNPDGHLVLDVLSARAFAKKQEGIEIAENLMDGFWSEKDYIGLQRSFTYPELLLSLDRYLIVQESGSREIFNWLQHFTADDIERELTQAGFVIEVMVGSLAGEELVHDSSSIAVVARKP
jgi:SAM-dependent methyltransferase